MAIKLGINIKLRKFFQHEPPAARTHYGWEPGENRSPASHIPWTAQRVVPGGFPMKILDRIALVLVIIGGLNWGSIGFFGLDMVAALFGGSASGLSRLVYILVCVAALWCITLFFREDRVVRRPAA